MGPPWLDLADVRHGLDHAAVDLVGVPAGQHLPDVGVGPRVRGPGVVGIFVTHLVTEEHHGPRGFVHHRTGLASADVRPGDPEAHVAVVAVVGGVERVGHVSLLRKTS